VKAMSCACGTVFCPALAILVIADTWDLPTGSDAQLSRADNPRRVPKLQREKCGVVWLFGRAIRPLCPLAKQCVANVGHICYFYASAGDRGR
jgi:hypothetical protein